MSDDKLVIEKQITIKNKQGLHARPAAIFVQIANKYESEITVKKDNDEINGKSIMGILMLAAEEDSIVFLKAVGIDAKEAVDELEQVLLKQTEDLATLKANTKSKVKKRKNNI